MESGGIELVISERVITIGFNRIGVLEAVATEFIYAGCALNNIYINQPPNQYSQE